MIRAVKVTNYLGDSIELDLANPEKSGFYIRDITGLGAPKADINSTEMATSDGAFYNSARAQSRNIVVTLGFLSQPDVETVRQLSYQYFPVKKPLVLTFVTDWRVLEIYGYVESNEPVIFSDEETTQISIMCLDPYFYSKDVNSTLFAGVVPAFEFPFSNESLTKNLIEMGEMQATTTRTIWYDGTAEVGVIIRIYAFGSVSNLSIYDPDDVSRKMAIDSARLAALTGKGIVEGDVIVISTVRGGKSIFLTRNGVEYNILNALNRDMYWFQLVKGDNLFAYTAASGLANLNFTIEHRTVYEGV